jgi:hypothetical protein
MKNLKIFEEYEEYMKILKNVKIFKEYEDFEISSERVYEAFEARKF